MCVKHVGDADVGNDVWSARLWEGPGAAVLKAKSPSAAVTATIVTKVTWNEGAASSVLPKPICFYLFLALIYIKKIKGNLI